MMIRSPENLQDPRISIRSRSISNGQEAQPAPLGECPPSSPWDTIVSAVSAQGF